MAAVSVGERVCIRSGKTRGCRKMKAKLAWISHKFQANFIPNKLPMRERVECAAIFLRTTMILTSIIWNQIQFDARRVREWVWVNAWRAFLLAKIIRYVHVWHGWMCHCQLPFWKTRVKSAHMWVVWADARFLISVLTHKMFTYSHSQIAERYVES